MVTLKEWADFVERIADEQELIRPGFPGHLKV